MSRQGAQPAAWRPELVWASASVWPLGQRRWSAQLRERGYVAETEKDSHGLSPAIAAHVVESYSWPGALVVDPDCGAGTAMVEALRAGRSAVGMTMSSRWWRVARANITAAKQRGAWPDGAVLDTSMGVARAVQVVGLARRVDLVLTSIRLPTVVRSLGPDSDFANRARGWVSLLRPGGYAVVVLRSHRLTDGTLLDLGTEVTEAADAAGLVVVDRCVALTGPLRCGRVVVRASALERAVVDRARVLGMPIGLVAHRTVLVLRSPTDAVDGHNALCAARQAWPTGMAAA